MLGCRRRLLIYFGVMGVFILLALTQTSTCSDTKVTPVNIVPNKHANLQLYQSHLSLFKTLFHQMADLYVG